MSPLMQRRLANFRKNRRGVISLRIFLVLFVLCMLAEFIANDKPLFIYTNEGAYFPVFSTYSEAEFGGVFETEAVYKDPAFTRLIEAQDGFILWPLVPYDYSSINYDLQQPAPAPPSFTNVLGTDDQGRDLLARLIYGFRISVLFGLLLTAISSVIGIIVGALEGYIGGWFDLLTQRLIEIISNLPALYILIILSSLIEPSFWWLLAIMAFFSWTALVGVVRAEFLKARNMDYVRAAKALGVKERLIVFRHILPNAMVASLTYMPFILSASVVTLTALDFLGLGMPPGSPSLGELLSQGKTNLNAPWLGITGFVTIALMLSLLTFVGEAVRDAFSPTKS